MQTLDDYFRSQQVPLQWSPFLRALSQELSITANGDSDALRSLFRAVGYRFAGDLSGHFKEAETLQELTNVFNEVWCQSNWGLVDLAQHNDHISIEHRFSPLAEAFGLENLAWSIGLLEGFYQAGFKQAGAGEDLTVRFSGTENDGLRLVFRLATRH